MPVEVFRPDTHYSLPLTRYPWENSIGGVKTPEPTATPNSSEDTAIPTP